MNMERWSHKRTNRAPPGCKERKRLPRGMRILGFERLSFACFALCLALKFGLAVSPRQLIGIPTLSAGHRLYIFAWKQVSFVLGGRGRGHGGGRELG